MSLVGIDQRTMARIVLDLAKRHPITGERKEYFEGNGHIINSR